MGTKAEVRPIVFSNGEDTLACGGSISADRIHATFTNMPLAVESDVMITQLVNITNTDSSDHYVQISVGAEDFGNELSSIKIYLVSPSGTETLVVELDNSANVVTENVSVNIPQGQEWAIKLAGHYDSGTSSSQGNSMTLHFHAM